MKLLPFRFRPLGDQLLVTSEGGDFAFVQDDLIPRLFENKLSVEEKDMLLEKRIICPSEDDWRLQSLGVELQRKYAKRRRSIRYLMVIPTLRCNLACSYCQVSRAPIDASGFDWDKRHLSALESFIKEYGSNHIKVEFQGGEISLRPDMIEAVEEIVQRHSDGMELVACTNLFEISPEFEKFFAKPNFYISTSLDGDYRAMSANRTGNDENAKGNIENIKRVIRDYGNEKISFLPTITENNVDDPCSLIDLYRDLGASGIFLRPVNFMGFARKRHQSASSGFENWRNFFDQSLEHIKQINRTQYFEEVYVADLVRQVFLRELGAFIDFRSPSNFLCDMAVIDFDGTVYPSDEARMLTRTKHIDLSVGNIFDGLDEAKIQQLNAEGLKETNPDCMECAYQPYCGVDLIDDLSRYKRIDMPKRETWFCNKQTYFFDWIFDKIQRRDAEWLTIFSRWAYKKCHPTQNVDALIA